ncbi:MAG: NAD(P)/FAD-dependent oxidoreductase [Alkalispirochaetaceae bacterium]
MSVAMGSTIKEYYDGVIIGAGIAGVTAARTIKELKPGMSVLLVNGEDRLPYKRTKISKHLRTGYQRDQFLLYPEQWYQEQGIDLLVDRTATGLDPASKTVAFGDNSSVTYGKLLLAPGSEPMFPKVVRPHESDSFYVVRDARDGERLVKGAGRAKSVLVSGMGILSVEIASELVAMGKEVTLIGATAQLIPKQLSLRASEILEELLTRRGIKLQFQEEILSFEENKQHRMEVQLLRRSSTFDMVVICIGVQPRLTLAIRGGLETGRGIKVDEYLRTSAPDVLSAGDAAEHPGGRITRLWHEAEYQGMIAGRNMAGEEQRNEAPPFRLKAEIFDHYFFSINKPADPLEVDSEEYETANRYWALYFRDGLLDGVVSVNDRDRAKSFEQAVRERWDRETVHRNFEFV